MAEFRFYENPADSQTVTTMKLGDGYGDFGGPGEYSPEDDMKNPLYWATREPAVAPPGDYVNAFSPNGTHTSLDKKFEDTMLAAVKQSDPNPVSAPGYALPPAAPNPMPQLILLSGVAFAAYWFLIRK